MKNPCEPAAVAADEERLPEIDDGEHGEEVTEREAMMNTVIQWIFSIE
jgi:hypothetical protein